MNLIANLCQFRPQLAKCITVELKSAELLCPQMDKCSLLDGPIKISITEQDFCNVEWNGALQKM